MKKFKKTPLGRLVFFIGSIRFAIPLLVLTAAALAYGTWIESSISARQAGITVYGSWWFITLMILICVTLILAVITRMPIKKKHTGFIIVHASLITIIVSAFVTFFTKVEGEMALREDTFASTLRTEFNELQILSHNEGQFELIDAAIVEETGFLNINGVEIEVLERWDNSAQETIVVNDGDNKLHAIELNFGAGDEGHWLGQLREGETPPILHDIEVRVLPEGQTWTPPALDEKATPVLRHATNAGTIELSETGITVSEGWTVESIKWFNHATVGDDGLAEGEPTRDNPAIEVILANTDGSRERHAAFERFRTSINKTQLEGELFSEFVLEYQGHGLDRPTLAITRDEAGSSVLYVTPDGQRTEQRLDGDAPWTIDLAGHPLTILHAYSNARGSTKLVQAAQAAENTPAIKVQIDYQHDTQDGHIHDPMILVWGQRSVINVAGEFIGIAYAPKTTPVPFTIKLVDFRKMDYPGTEMAMAYESDVVFTDEHGNTHEQTIWMNNPLEYEGWKVYQAGFIGGDLSIFQVTRDPGLIPMYIGCVVLFLGIFVMYYSKAYTYGHPGMPKVFESKTAQTKNTRNTTHETTHNTSGDAHLVADDHDNTSGRASRLESQVRSDSGTGSRAHHADGHPRKKGRSRSHRANKLG